MSAAEVSENVKQAREQALLGCYDEAKVFYMGATQSIQQLIKQTHDTDMKEKWKTVCVQFLDSSTIICLE